MEDMVNICRDFFVNAGPNLASITEEPQTKQNGDEWRFGGHKPQDKSFN